MLHNNHPSRKQAVAKKIMAIKIKRLVSEGGRKKE